MNRENDILNRTRFLIQGLKDYTDARIDDAAEDAVRRVIKKQINKWLKKAGAMIFVIFMFSGLIGLVLVGVYIMNSDASISIRISHFVVILTWTAGLCCMICDADDET